MQRISQSMMSGLFLQDMHKSLKRLMDIEQQMSSQQLYSRPSDNPAEVARALTVRTTISKNEQYQRNLEDAVTWLSNTETALGQVTDVVSSIRENAIYAVNAGLSEVDRNAIAKDIDAMRDELVQIANFNVEGRFLLGGLKTSSNPFTKDKSGEVHYEGDLNRIFFEVEKGLTSAVSFNGRDVFPNSFNQWSVKSIEVPENFSWKGSSEVLQISVGDKTARVDLPQRWNDNNSDSISDRTDYDGFISSGENVKGYSLQNIADIINNDTSTGKIVHASVEKNSLSNTQTLKIKSLSGEPVQVMSVPMTENIEKGQILNSDSVVSTWTAGSDGQIVVDMPSGETETINISSGENLDSVAASLSGIEGIWAGVREDNSISIVAEGASGSFSVSPSGSGNDLFSSSTESSAITDTSDFSHGGLAVKLGLSTAITSTELEEGSNFGNTTTENLNIMFRSGDRKLELKITDDPDLTLEDLADRIKAAAGEWIDVSFQKDSSRDGLSGFSSDSETATSRLMLRTKDGSALTVYDQQNNWAKKLGIQTASATEGLSNLDLLNTVDSDVPLKLGVEISGELHEVKLHKEDISIDGVNIDPEKMGLQIREQVGSEIIDFDVINSGKDLSLYSKTGGPLRIVDLPFGDPDMDGITSGLAALSGLQTGITGDKVDSTATVTSDGSFKVRSGSREITISVLVGESIGEVAGRIDDLAGSWLDVSLSKDSSGGTVGYRLSLSPKDGSPVNVYDIEGTAAKDDLGINTDIRIKKVSDPIGGTLKVNVDGYTHTIDLSDVITGLDQVSDLINSRFSSEDVRTEIVNNTEMVIYSPAGKDISIEGNPAGMVLSETSTPERSPLSGNSPNSQNLSVRSGADYERKDLFAMLDDLSTAVRQGSDSVISESFLPRMDRAMNDVLRVRSSTGALQRRYETANNRMKENNIAFTGLYSNIMDVDMAEAAMEFQTAQTVYQATLATISKVVQPTLIDYLS